MRLNTSSTAEPTGRVTGLGTANGAKARTIARQAAELRAMALELTHAQQQERERLARILHDHLQQYLVAARMRLSSLERLLGDSRQEGLCRQIDLLLKESVEITRNLAVELQPPMLAQQGLAATLTWLGRHYQGQYGVAVSVEADAAADPLSHDVALVLLAAVQELLLNVVKHAGVNQAGVTMRAAGPRGVVIEVTDQGRGFAVSGPAEAPTAFGLPSLRRRLAALGGRVEIESLPGRGTTARLTASRT